MIWLLMCDQLLVLPAKKMAPPAHRRLSGAFHYSLIPQNASPPMLSSAESKSKNNFSVFSKNIITENISMRFTSLKTLVYGAFKGVFFSIKSPEPFTGINRIILTLRT
jgi:hypothetical protein